MTRFTARFILIAFFAYSCSHKRHPVAALSKFTSFEIAYTNGWTKGFALYVDSNKIFFSPQAAEKVKYGLLPDSLFQPIDSLVLNITSDALTKSTNGGCVDCSIVAIQAIAGNDTFNIQQVGKIDVSFWPIIKKLEYFLDSGNHTSIHGSLSLQSQRLVFPLPLPPISNQRKTQ